MIAFEIFVNGQKKFTAGGDDFLALTTSLTLLHHLDSTDYSLLFNTSGIVEEPPTTTCWPDCEIVPGDRIEIRVIHAEVVDTPERITKCESTDDNAA